MSHSPQSGGAPAVEIEGLRAGYGEGRDVVAVETLRIARARVAAVLGSNGAGKSTLLRCLALLHRPRAGALGLWGSDPYASRSALLSARRRLALVAQDPYLLRGNVFGNVAYGLRVRGMPRRTWAGRVEETLGRLDLAGYGERDSRELSGGEEQRVALARALAPSPELLILDEPTAQVDRARAPLIVRLLRELAGAGTTVILATHDLGLAAQVADDIIHLREGRVVEGAAANVFSGEADECEGQPVVRLEGGPDLQVVGHHQGRTSVAIDPAEIVVSLDPLVSSARNSLQGRVVDIAEQDGQVHLGVDCGLRLLSVVTRRSFEELGLTLGSEVHLTFKASAVKVW